MPVMFRGKRRWVLIGVVAMVLIAAGIVIWGFWRPPPQSGPPLADKLRGYRAQPASGLSPDLAPGTLLRVANMALVARPGQAYRRPGKLVSPWQELMKSGRFTDSLESSGELEADILAFIGRSGSRQALQANRVASATTEIEGLQSREVTELQLKDAALRGDLAEMIASGEGVVVIQTVFRARSMKVRYQDARGASVTMSLPESELPSLKSDASVAKSGDEEYADVVLGYKALFIAGGEGSPMTAATAKELARDTSSKGYKATALGNLVLVEVAPGTARPLSELSKSAVARDRKKAAGDTAGAEQIRRNQTEFMKRIPSRTEAIQRARRIRRP